MFELRVRRFIPSSTLMLTLSYWWINRHLNIDVPHRNLSKSNGRHIHIVDLTKFVLNPMTVICWIISLFSRWNVIGACYLYKVLRVLFSANFLILVMLVLKKKKYVKCLVYNIAKKCTVYVPVTFFANGLILIYLSLFYHFEQSFGYIFENTIPLLFWYFYCS